MKFTAVIHVRPKPEIRDPQGEAVGEALRSIGLDVGNVRAGKELVVQFEASDERAAQEIADAMGKQLLANPVIEDFAVDVRPA